MTESINHFLNEFKSYEKAKAILLKLELEGFKTWLAGGCVRDAILKRKIFDFDMATEALPGDVISLFGKENCLRQGEKFGSIGVKYEGEVFEITSFRSEKGSSNNRHPDKIIYSTKEEDVKRRDFSINGLLFHPERGLFDIVNGFKDIKEGKLTAIGDPDERFKEDALRILRLYRFSLNLNFQIDKRTMQSSIKNIKLLLGISNERVNDEIKKAFSRGFDVKRLNAILYEYGLAETSLNQESINSSRSYIFNLAVLNHEYAFLKINMDDYLFLKAEKKEFLFYKKSLFLLEEGDKKELYHNICKNMMNSRKSVSEIISILKRFKSLKFNNVDLNEVIKHLAEISEEDIFSYKEESRKIRETMSGSEISRKLLEYNLKFYFLLN